MNCPGCDSESTRVLKTIDDGKSCARRHACDDCGGEFFTDQLHRKGSYRPPRQRLDTARGSQGPPVMASNEQPVASEEQSTAVTGQDSGGVHGEGGVGSVSDLFPGLSDLRIPSSKSTEDLRKKPRRAARARAVESPAFAAFYEAYPKHIDRAEASDVWNAKQLDALADKIMAAVAIQKPALIARGEPHLIRSPARWLRRENWNDDPSAYRIAAPGANGSARRPSPPQDPRCAFHRGPDSANRVSYCPLPGCPECKHVRARNAARTGEPTGLDAMVADLVNGAAK